MNVASLVFCIDDTHTVPIAALQRSDTGHAEYHNASRVNKPPTPG